MDAPPTRYVRTADGVNLAVNESGAGEPLVWLPFPFTHSQLVWTSPLFRHTFECLGARFRLLQYDSRGQGQSDRGLPDALSFEDFVSDLEAVMDCLDLRRVVLLAPGHFGKVGIRYAARHPDRVKALVLWNAFPRLTSGSVSGSAEALARSNWDFLIEATVRTAFPQDTSGAQEAITRQGITQEDFIKLIRVINGEDIEADLGRLQVPTLVMATRHNAWSFAAEEASRHLAAAIAGAQFRIYDDIGGGLYTLSEETPPAIEALQDFVDGLPDSATTPAVARSDLGLSEREQEVLLLIADGKSNAQIAEDLVISPRTVDRHVANILSKTGATNRTQAVTLARESGLT